MLYIDLEIKKRKRSYNVYIFQTRSEVNVDFEFIVTNEDPALAKKAMIFLFS